MSGDFGSQQFQRRQFKHKPSDIEKKAVDHDVIRNQLKVPAKGLLASGAVSVFLIIAGTVGGLIYGATQTERIVNELVYRIYGVEQDEQTRRTSNRGAMSKKEKEQAERRESQANMVMTLTIGVIIIAALVLSCLHIFSVAAGVLMGQLRNYKVCRLACILAVIPLVSPLLVVGIPFGLMGLMKLSQPKVKKAFS